MFSRHLSHCNDASYSDLLRNRVFIKSSLFSLREPYKMSLRQKESVITKPTLNQAVLPSECGMKQCISLILKLRCCLSRRLPICRVRSDQLDLWNTLLFPIVPERNSYNDHWQIYLITIDHATNERVFYKIRMHISNV